MSSHLNEIHHMAATVLHHQPSPGHEVLSCVKEDKRPKNTFSFPTCDPHLNEDLVCGCSTVLEVKHTASFKALVPTQQSCNHYLDPDPDTCSSTMTAESREPGALVRCPMHVDKYKPSHVEVACIHSNEEEML